MLCILTRGGGRWLNRAEKRNGVGCHLLIWMRSIMEFPFGF